MSHVIDEATLPAFRSRRVAPAYPTPGPNLRGAAARSWSTMLITVAAVGFLVGYVLLLGWFLSAVLNTPWAWAATLPAGAVATLFCIGLVADMQRSRTTRSVPRPRSPRAGEA